MRYLLHSTDRKIWLPSFQKQTWHKELVQILGEIIMEMAYQNKYQAQEITYLVLNFSQIEIYNKRLK